MATFTLELVSIEKPLWSGEANALYGRTVAGELGILPGHTPLLGALAPGFPVRIERPEGEDLIFAVHGAVLSVRKDGVSVLAEMAESAAEVDVDRAKAALEGAKGDSDSDIAARNRANARLRAAGESV